MVPCSLARCWSSYVTLRWRIVSTHSPLENQKAGSSSPLKPSIPQPAEERRKARSTCRKSLATASPEHLCCSGMSGNVRSTLSQSQNFKWIHCWTTMRIILASTISILTQKLVNNPRLPTCSLTQVSSAPVKAHASQLTPFHELTVIAKFSNTC